MKIHKVNTNSLLVTGFGCYWLFVLFLTFLNGQNPLKQKIENSSLSFLFPPNYKMFASAPQNHFYTEYNFYLNGESIQKINIDSLVKTRLKSEFPGIEMRKTIRNDLMFFSKPNIQIGNQYRDYVYKNQKFPNQNESWYLNKMGAIYLENQFNYANILRKEIPKLAKADSFDLSIFHDRIIYDSLGNRLIKTRLIYKNGKVF